MRLGVMCSGNGTNFENIVTNPICKEHEVIIMIHNKKKCGAAKRAEKWGIPHCYVSHKDEEQMVKLFEAWRVDLIVLAGYMRVIKNISDIYKIQNVYDTEILSASIRYVNSVSQSFANGANVVTMPPAVFEKMYNHILTEKGLQLFDEDWKQVAEKIA